MNNEVQLIHPLSKPSERVPVDTYTLVRDWLIRNDPDGLNMYQWSTSSRGRPNNADEMAGEVIWIILCAGRKAQAARTIERKVWGALAEGKPVFGVFGYRGKTDAIEDVWGNREQYFKSLKEVLDTETPEKLVDWCGALRYVGDDTKFQLAKNFGADVAKPDIWLCRLSGIADTPRRPVRFRFQACMALCQFLSGGSGDSVATIDTMLWLACNKGILRVGADGGAVSLHLNSVPERGALTMQVDPNPQLSLPI